MTRFCDSAIELLEQENVSTQLRLYFYAATLSGWKQLQASALIWKNALPNRSVTAYIGTDHALTDPEAIEEMIRDNVSVMLLRHYRGVFHPKVLWFVTPAGGILLSGSNNLTEDGLKNNIEFATRVDLNTINQDLVDWHNAIHSASELASTSLLNSYRNEKQRFGSSRAASGAASTFTWTKRTSGDHLQNNAPPDRPLGSVRQGDLILEVMKRETSAEGRQVQIPMAVAYQFFGLGQNVYDQVVISLTSLPSRETRRLTVTHNSNSTARISIRELEYRSRPCLLLIRKRRRNTYDFELVRRSIDPARYNDLIRRCNQSGSRRRWTILT